MANAIKYSAPSGATTALSTGLDSLASAARAISSTVSDNREQYADFELVATFGVAPVADAPVYLYFIEAPDGTNFEDGSTSVTPSAPPDAIFTVRAVTTAQRVVRTRVPLPNGDYQVLLINSAGQAMAASGNTIKFWSWNDEVQ